MCYDLMDSDGNLYLSYEKDVVELPDNLVVEGNLDIADCLFEELPSGLVIKGDLIAHNTQLAALPEDIIVLGKIFLDNTYIKDLEIELAKNIKDKFVSGFILVNSELISYQC